MKNMLNVFLPLLFLFLHPSLCFFFDIEPKYVQLNDPQTGSINRQILFELKFLPDEDLDLMLKENQPLIKKGEFKLVIEFLDIGLYAKLKKSQLLILNEKFIHEHVTEAKPVLFRVGPPDFKLKFDTHTLKIRLRFLGVKVRNLYQSWQFPKLVQELNPEALELKLNPILGKVEVNPYTIEEMKIMRKGLKLVCNQNKKERNCPPLPKKLSRKPTDQEIYNYFSSLKEFSRVLNEEVLEPKCIQIETARHSLKKDKINGRLTQIGIGTMSVLFLLISIVPMIFAGGYYGDGCGHMDPKYSIDTQERRQMKQRYREILESFNHEQQ